ncbi:hypothetical protein PDJAM_G00053700, partial [Pangasius djambal]|nr:hypothetical protein [Pangasius djambal]
MGFKVLQQPPQTSNISMLEAKEHFAAHCLEFLLWSGTGTQSLGLQSSSTRLGELLPPEPRPPSQGLQ